MISSRLLPLVVVLPVIACGVDPLSPDEHRALQLAQTRWDERGFADYAFVTSQTCFCSPEQLVHVEIEVRAGAVASVTDIAGDSLLPATTHDSWYTVDDLFERIRDAGRDPLVSDVVADFDTALGYPKAIVVDFPPDVLDAGSTVEISELLALSPAPPALVEVLPGFPFASWFTDRTGYAAHPDYFGAYSMLAVGGILYVGFGAALPAQRNGALLASLTGRNLEAAATLSEQGFLDMAGAGGTVLLPGVDPCCPDGWEFGNFYTYAPEGGLTKRRNLPWVFHAWGVWYDALAEITYLATSAHLGDSVTLTGEVWRSPDFGATWERLANRDNGVGNFRTLDVVRMDTRLYAVRSNTVGQTFIDICALVAEPDSGSTWSNPFPADTVACRNRIITLPDRLGALGVNRDVLHVVTSAGTPLTVTLPFTIDITTYNWATVVDGTAFAVGDGGAIWRSADLIAWDRVLEPTGMDLMSVQYWPHRGWLALASRGTSGALWRLRLCGTVPC